MKVNGNSMGWGKFITLALIGLAIKSSGNTVKKPNKTINRNDDSFNEDNETENNRIYDYSCKFDNGLTESEFKLMAELIASRIPPIISLSVQDAVVYAEVISNSGKTTWNFKVNFNDNRNVTGRKWVYTDNDDSSIPYSYADRLSKAVFLYFNELNYTDEGEFINTRLSTYLAETAEQKERICEVFEDGYIENQLIQERKAEEERQAREREKAEKERLERLRAEAEAKEALRLRLEAEKQAEIERVKREKHDKRIRWIKKYWLASLSSVLALAAIAVLSFAYVRMKKLTQIGFTDENLIGLTYSRVERSLRSAGFTNIEMVDADDLTSKNADQDGKVFQVLIGKTEDFTKEDQFPYDEKIVIYYHSLKYVNPPGILADYQYKLYELVVNEFEEAGFINVKTEGLQDLIIGLFNRENEVADITINGKNDFKSDESYLSDVEVIVYYHSFSE